MTHALKAWPDFYKAVESGQKNFELRKKDRDFKVGEKLLLQEYDPENKKYTGKELEKEIQYILSEAAEFGLQEGYCILGLKDIFWQ